jgi:hypothetical protein
MKRSRLASKGVGERTTCESGGGARKSEVMFLSALRPLASKGKTIGLRDKGSRDLSSRDSSCKFVKKRGGEWPLLRYCRNWPCDGCKSG